MNLQNNLLKQLKRKGITLTALAPTIHGCTTGLSVRSLADLKKVCTVLEVGLHKILFETDDPFQSSSMEIKEPFKGNIQITIHTVLKDSG